MVSQTQDPRAPLDPAGLADALRPFGASRMLPPAAYTDPAVFSWEQQHFFGGGWTCVGFSAELASPGDQRAVPVGAGDDVVAQCLHEPGDVAPRL